MSRKPCSICQNAQAVRAGGLCNRCFTERLPVKRETSHIPLDEVEIDYDLQARTGVDMQTVEDYAAAIEEGEEFPDAVIFEDEETGKLWLADGFHRYLAYKKLGKETINADVRLGSRRDAILYSLSANARHGLQRSDADKRKAVQTLLADSEWSQWSAREIAKAARVSRHLVAKLRETPAVVTYARSGEERQMETAGITSAPKSSESSTGRAASAESPPKADRPKPAAKARPTDMVGIPVEGDRAADYFKTIEAYREADDLLKSMADVINAVCSNPGGEHLERRCTRKSKAEGEKVKFASQHLDALKRDLRDSIPWSTVCPYCNRLGRIDRMCAACRGTNWCCRASWDNAPDDLKQAVIDAYAEK